MWNLSRHDIPDYNDATGYTPGYGVWGRLSYTTTPDTPIVNRGVRASLFVEPLYEDAAFLDPRSPPAGSSRCMAKDSTRTCSK